MQLKYKKKINKAWKTAGREKEKRKNEKTMKDGFK
jgi:hypothetical protein